MTRYGHRRTVTSATLLVTIAAGLALRFAPLPLPYFIWKYGGSALWAMAVYWMLAAMVQSASPRTLAASACTIALAVELSRLIVFAPLDAFRLTLAGRLLLGRLFSLWNVMAYWLAIAATAIFDRRKMRKEQS